MRRQQAAHRRRLQVGRAAGGGERVRGDAGGGRRWQPAAVEVRECCWFGPGP